MFTGIIAATGSIQKIEDRGEDKRFTINTGKLDLSDVSMGDSISVNGTCLTVIELQENAFSTDLSTETLDVTTFAAAKEGDMVNLEKALMLSDRLGGHIVSGHVDGIGVISDFYEDARSLRYEIAIPAELNRYLCKKGSICIDGVSLTVNEVATNIFSVNIIPHTMDETIFSSYKKNSKVNLEVDLIARYLEGLQRE
ncbi:MAG: riboflavin synthase [Gammaproteobacteria bacterium]|jgi:riboflavin synthase|nr:riboflavin synthase [Gammaproteobacteria bacterium]